MHWTQVESTTGLIEKRVDLSFSIIQKKPSKSQDLFLTNQYDGGVKVYLYNLFVYLLSEKHKFILISINIDKV